jgi:hypothetical protein
MANWPIRTLNFEFMFTKLLNSSTWWNASTLNVNHTLTNTYIHTYIWHETWSPTYLDWGSATLTEVRLPWLRFRLPWLRFRLPWLRFFPYFFLSCKANARVQPAKTGHGPHSSKIFALFYVLFVVCRSVYCLCVNVYCTTASGWLSNCS